MISRIRKRDLFCLAGEILLRPDQVHLAKSGGSEAKAGVLEVLRRLQICADDQTLPTSVPNAFATGQYISDNDVVCSVVRMGYGKGGKNPVTDMTTFYRPTKPNFSPQYDSTTSCHSSCPPNLPQYFTGCLPAG